jgi:hypothetical protein
MSTHNLYANSCKKLASDEKNMPEQSGGSDASTRENSSADRRLFVGYANASLSFDTLQENNRKHTRIASLLQQYDPVAASRLLACSRFIQQRLDGSWQASYHCRQHKLCLNCQAIRSQQLRNQFETAVAAFETEMGVPLRLASFVLHPQLDDDVSADCQAVASLQAIAAFGDRFAVWRTKQLSNWSMVNQLKRNNASKQNLVGPAMLSTHVDPPVTVSIAGRRIAKPEKSHLHLLVAMPERFRVTDFRNRLESLWITASKSIVAVTGVVVVKKTTICEDASHTSNLIAYSARPIKSRWSPGQSLAASNRLQQTPRRAIVRVLGAVTELEKLPHKTPITGDVMEFSHDEMCFKRLHTKDWV